MYDTLLDQFEDDAPSTVEAEFDSRTAGAIGDDGEPTADAATDHDENNPETLLEQDSDSWSDDPVPQPATIPIRDDVEEVVWDDEDADEGEN